MQLTPLGYSTNACSNGSLITNYCRGSRQRRSCRSTPASRRKRDLTEPFNSINIIHNTAGECQGEMEMAAARAESRPLCWGNIYSLKSNIRGGVTSVTCTDITYHNTDRQILKPSVRKKRRRFWLENNKRTEKRNYLHR